jgi:hypothetical protein
MRKGRKLLLSGILMFLTGIILLTTPFWSQIYFNRVPSGTLYFKEETRQILTPEDAAIKKLKSTARLKVFALKNLKSGDIISLNLSLPQLFPQYRIYKGSVIMIPVDYSGRQIDVTLLSDKGDLLYQKKIDLFYDQKEAGATIIDQDSGIIINISSNNRITQYKRQ